MSPILEPNYYGLWGAKQPSKGTAATMTSAKRLVQVGGDFGLARDDGEENYSDLTKYGARTDWVNSLLGNGEPVVEATPTELAWALWMLHGGETVSAVTGPPTAQKHSFAPSLSRPHWGTFHSRIGNTVGPVRRQWLDCLITRVAVEMSTANKAVRFTPRIISLDPAQNKTADPTPGMPADKALLFTDASGTFTLDGTVYPGMSAASLTIDEAYEPVFGDSATPFDVVQGNPAVTVGATLLLDTAALALFNMQVYGSATPALDAKPRSGIPALGSFSWYAKQRDSAGALNGREFKAAFPANTIKWDIPDFPGPAPDGGATELAFSGTLRTGGYTIDVNTDNTVTAFTV